MTALWSGAPFFVENIIKVTQGKQLEVLTDLTLSLREELDKSCERELTITNLLETSAKREEGLLAVCNALVDSLVDPNQGERS